jgi:hypothetical protein
VTGYANLPTYRQQQACRAFGLNALANEFSKRHKTFIDFYPVPLWQFVLELGQRLLGCARRHVAPAVSDAMDVDIHGDLRFVESNSNRQRGDLRPNAPEAGQFLDSVWYSPAVFLGEFKQTTQKSRRVNNG